MAIDSSAPRSRRAILGAALGGAGALFAHALGRATPVQAADGDPLELGASDNAATNSTVLSSDADGIVAVSNHTIGLYGRSTTISDTPGHNTGVVGATGDGTDIAPNTDFTGVYGFSDDPDTFAAAGVWGDSLTGIGTVGTGFFGTLGSGVIGTVGFVDEVNALPGAVGVYGLGSSSYSGVYGFVGDDGDPGPAAKAGVTGRAGLGATYGVVAAAPGPSQYALYVAGRLRLSRSAKTPFASTATSKRITMAGVTSSSFVVATLQTAITGCYVRAVVCGTGAFTIYLSKAPGKTAYVGYVVVN